MSLWMSMSSVLLPLGKVAAEMWVDWNMRELIRMGLKWMYCLIQYGDGDVVIDVAVDVVVVAAAVAYLGMEYPRGSKIRQA